MDFNSNLVCSKDISVLNRRLISIMIHHIQTSACILKHYFDPIPILKANSIHGVDSRPLVCQSKNTGQGTSRQLATYRLPFHRVPFLSPWEQENNSVVGEIGDAVRRDLELSVMERGHQHNNRVMVQAQGEQITLHHY